MVKNENRTLRKDDASYLYITCLLNSRLLDYYLQHISVPFRGGFYSANRQFLEPLLIRLTDFDNPAEKKRQYELLTLVTKMLELQKRLAPIRDTRDSERDELIREIEHTDDEIDQKVYELYGITEEERRLIEESVKG